MSRDGDLPTVVTLPQPEFLTPVEREAIKVAGRLAALCAEIAGHEHTRDDDLREIVLHVHAIQNAVLAQAAARAYPDTYRLMGESFYDAEGNRKCLET